MAAWWLTTLTHALPFRCVGMLLAAFLAHCREHARLELARQDRLRRVP